MNSSNLIVNSNKCLKELGLLMANHKCRLDAKRVVFSGAAITLIASPGGRIKKLYVDEVGMLDVKDLRTLYKKGGIQSMQSQPGQATLWTATGVVDGAVSTQTARPSLTRTTTAVSKRCYVTSKGNTACIVLSNTVQVQQEITGRRQP